MNIEWFKNIENIAYVNMSDFIPHFAKKFGILNLEDEIKEFIENPNKKGKTLIGKKQTEVKLFIPKKVFKERIEHDENVWMYMGESSTCYCLYETEPWWDKSYAFFCHKECECFPCHKTNDEDKFNCLFCYCPLYALKDKCGGNFRYYGDVKDCSKCEIPHKRSGYGYIIGKYKEIAEISKKIIEK